MYTSYLNYYNFCIIFYCIFLFYQIFISATSTSGAARTPTDPGTITPINTDNDLYCDSCPCDSDSYLMPGNERGVFMKPTDFNQLINSIQEAGEIRHGKKKASRTFEFTLEDVKQIRKNLGKSQTEFALMKGDK